LRPIWLGRTAIVPRRQHDRIAADVWVVSRGHPACRHLPSPASARIMWRVSWSPRQLPGRTPICRS